MGRKWGVFIGLGVLAAGCAMIEPAPGRQVFESYCAGCHGASATGDGPMAEGLPVPPADLTILSAANDGVFPAEHVMTTVYGYPGKHEISVMPEFGPLLDGPRRDWIAPDGKAVPTPVMLLDLVSYLEGLQR